MTRAEMFRRFIALLVVITCGTLTSSIAAQNATTKYSVHTLTLPDNSTGDVSMDYIAFDPATNSLWVPAGNTGAVDVVDVATANVRQIPNMATAEDLRKKRRDCMAYLL